MTIEKLTGTLTVEGRILDISNKDITVCWIEDDTLSEGNTLTDGDRSNKITRTYFVPLENINFPENYSLDELRQRLDKKQRGKDYSFPIQHVIQPNGESKIKVLLPIDY